jgi:hypothetical protein
MPRGKTNKSQAIRDMLTANPTMPVKEVVSTLATRGIKVTSNLVYYLRAKSRAKKRRAARKRVAASMSANGVDPLVLIRGIKELATQAGGMERLRQFVQELA